MTLDQDRHRRDILNPTSLLPPLHRPRQPRQQRIIDMPANASGTVDTNAAVTSGATSWTSTAVVDSRSRAGSKHRPKSVGETGVRANQYSTSSTRAAARSASAAVQARTDVPPNANAVPHQQPPPHTQSRNPQSTPATTPHPHRDDESPRPPARPDDHRHRHRKPRPPAPTRRYSDQADPAPPDGHAGSHRQTRAHRAGHQTRRRRPHSAPQLCPWRSTAHARPSSTANRAVNIGCTRPPHRPPPPTRPLSTLQAPSTPHPD